MPPGSLWETDPDAGPLTLTVAGGALEVVLDGGSARLERPGTVLTGEHKGPLQPGRATVLAIGDRLVVVRGFHLTVGNDHEAAATAIITRHHKGPLPA